MKSRMSTLVVLGLSAPLLLPLNLGCDDFFRRAANVFDGIADNIDDRNDRDAGDFIDDVLDDIEDWFD